MAGGLVSYGGSLTKLYERVGTYRVAFSRARSPPTSGRAVHESRADPQPQDRQGARPHVPPTLLGRADEVIE